MSMTTTDRPEPRTRRLASPKYLWLAAWVALAGALLWQAAPRPASETRPQGQIRTVSASASTPAHKTRTIERMALGDRVLAKNPEGSTDEPEVDPRTWRRVDLLMPKGGGLDVDIALLRPPGWFEATKAVVGGTVGLSMPEMGLEGPARVVSIGPCPAIRAGSGRVVTGTFTHDKAPVVDVRVEGLSKPIGATPWHRFYSEDRSAFVRADELRDGERLRLTDEGLARVESVASRVGNDRVYNLEVHGEHVYNISKLGVLVHNNYGGVYSVSGQKGFSRACYEL